MKKEQIQELFARFEAASGTINDVECWSARELQGVLGYAEWRNFTTVVDQAREACEAAGEKVSDHFVGINKMVTLGSASERTIEDIPLTRYACYLIAQIGDPAKPGTPCWMLSTDHRDVSAEHAVERGSGIACLAAPYVHAVGHG